MRIEENNERLAMNELYARWSEFAKYATKFTIKVKDSMLREYCSLLSNISVRFGQITQIVMSPDLSTEAFGAHVRDFERELVVWSGYLADFEARNAKEGNVEETTTTKAKRTTKKRN